MMTNEDTSSAHDVLLLRQRLDDVVLADALEVEVLHFVDPDPEAYFHTHKYKADPKNWIWLPAWIHRWDDKFLMKGMGHRDGGSVHDFEVYADGRIAKPNHRYKEWRYKNDTRRS